MADSKLRPVRNNPGIYKRNGNYVVRIWNPEKGKSGGWDNSTHGSLQAAKTEKRDAEARKVAQRRAGRRQFTVREWAEQKWPELFGNGWKDSTLAYNTERVSWFVRDFGDRLMHDIDPLEAAEWALEHPGRVRVVKTMFEAARRKRVIDENPFETVEAKQSRGRKDILTLKDHELDRLVHWAGEAHGDWGAEVFGPMIDFAAGGGMRPGEILGLARADFRERGSVVHVWRQMENKTGRIAPIKTEGHEDSPQEREVLLLPRARGVYEKLPKQSPLWPAKRGGPMTAQRLLVAWHDVRRLFTAELPESHHLRRRIEKKQEQARRAGKNAESAGALDFYELRHYFGTELAHAGFTVYEIAAQMGHNDIQTASTHYVHVDPAEIRKSMEDKLRRRYAA